MFQGETETHLKNTPQYAQLSKPSWGVIRLILCSYFLLHFGSKYLDSS